MRRIYVLLLLLTASAGNVFGGEFNAIWQSVNSSNVPSIGERMMIPNRYEVYAANSQVLQSELAAISEDPGRAQLFDLPMPDGHYRTFRVWQTPIMEKGLSDRYPGIYTFTGIAVDNSLVTAKLDYNQWGFHALVFDGDNTAFVDPYSNKNDGYYVSYYFRDYPNTTANEFKCLVPEDNASPAADKLLKISRGGIPNLDWHAAARTNGANKRVYRLAIACTGEYSVAVAGANPTKSAVLSKIVTSVNRINGVYQAQLAVSLSLIANTDAVIYLDGATDPYTTGQPQTELAENITNVNNVIGSANYDIGHLFDKGSGGVAYIGAICNSSIKAGGVSGTSNPQGPQFDLQVVAHEMGHQHGANHSFDGVGGACIGNRIASSAIEPASGSTIMSYAGTCTDNLQNGQDPYFHSLSLTQMSIYITSGTGSTCGTSSPSGNTPASQPHFGGTYSIPYKTPFELIAPRASDANFDSLLYGWEEWDIDNSSTGLSWTDAVNSTAAVPIFRSFFQTNSPTRICPRLSNVLSGTLTYLGETVPQVARSLKFKMITRDVYQGFGCFTVGDDSVVLNAVNTGSGFAVTSQNTAATNWTGGSTQTITWNVAGTNAAPISCGNVIIRMSVDGGQTWGYGIATAPNNGSATITVPNPASNSSQVRIKVKGQNNVFFNVNTTNFSFTHNGNIPTTNPDDTTTPPPPPTAIATPAGNPVYNVSIYPVPATEVLHILATDAKPLQVMVINTLGQTVWSNNVTKQADINVSGWAKGIYHVRLIDSDGAAVMKSVVVQ